MIGDGALFTREDAVEAPAPDDVVFLLDCDNTLLDNDLVQDDLRGRRWMAGC